MSREKKSVEKKTGREAALAAIHKKYGKEVIPAASFEEPVTDVIPTGSLSLDIGLGIGGYPRGRIIEIYGPNASGKTTLTLHAIAEVQKTGGRAAFIDAEHALDLNYAKALGVDLSTLDYFRPDSGEEALEVVETLTQSTEYALIVIDSVAALVPQKELEGEMGDSHVGLQARLMGQALRKLTAQVGSTGTTLMFLNQLRSKIGVMFGCFNYASRVVLADGSTMKIGKIVNQKLPVEVLSYNAETGAVEPRKVVSWFKNGKADSFLQITATKAGGNGRSQMGVTPNHVIFTPTGQVSAGDLRVGDEVLSIANTFFNQDQLSVAYGSLLGDGSLRIKGLNTQLRIGHGLDQTAYCKWKQSLFGSMVSYSGANATGGWSFDLKPSYDLTDLYSTLYTEQGRAVTDEFLSKLDCRAIAIWYMDDGSFSGSYDKWGHGKAEISVKSYSTADQNNLANALESLVGVRPTVTTKGTLLFSGERTAALHAAIAPYVHPSMHYKLHPDFRALPKVAYDTRTTKQIRTIPVVVTDIKSKPKTKSMEKFDLEVEGNHTYLVDGVVVHNSPETTTGGNALEFYASIRLDIRRIGSIKVGEEVVGGRTKVKIVKNKLAGTAHQTLEFTTYSNNAFGAGISREMDIFEHAVKLGLIEKSGAWYSYETERLGQGADNSLATLKQNPALLKKLEEAIISQVNLRQEVKDKMLERLNEV